jgi:hypothetical protein
MRRYVTLLLAFTASAALAQPTLPPVTTPPASTLAGAKPLPDKWEAITREIYKTAVETPTVAGRGQVPKLANYLAGKLKAAGWSDADVHVLPYTSSGDNKTAALSPAGPRRARRPRSRC